MDATAPRGAPVAAEGFGLKGPRGWVFRDVSFTATPGSLIAIEGPSGSGRTCLLLALAGRMRGTAGHAEVAGLRLPGHLGAVRRIAALGPVDGVAELEAALTVGEHLRERAWLQRRFEGPLGALLRPRRVRATEARTRVDRALAAAGFDPAALPKGPRTLVRDLERLEALRLGVALALLGEPRLLAVDDADHKLSGADRAAAWSMLLGIAEAGTTVLAVCTEAPQGAVVVRPDGRRPRPGPAGTDGPDGPDKPDEGDSAGGPDGAETADRPEHATAVRGAPDGAPEQACPADTRRTAGKQDTADARPEGREEGRAETAGRAGGAHRPAGSHQAREARDEVHEAQETEPSKGAADAYAEARGA